MPLYHTEDQAMLADTARSFLADEGNIAKQLRHWRDIGCKDGFGHALWKQFAELGFTGILVGEADGGLGMGHVEAGIVLEEIGRNLTPSPFLTSSVLAATALKDASAELRSGLPADAAPVPRLGAWGAVLLALLLGGVGVRQLRRR